MKEILWKWGDEEQAIFEEPKKVLTSDQDFVNLDPEKPLRLTCDVCNVGIGAVLFHCYANRSERPTVNVSKTPMSAVRNYSQIYKKP